VVLLTGRKTMSSCESFVGMMTGGTNVTTMGDATAGSSGNPKIVRLPLDMTVSVPRWIDLLPDGTPLDERGVQPQVRFEPKPGAFEGKHDDLLAAALERLRLAPLPAKPIEGPELDREADEQEPETGRAAANPPDCTAAMKEEAGDESRPRVLSVTPTNDAAAVGLVTELRVRFDRPMEPLSLKLDWDSGGFTDCEFPEYDPENNHPPATIFTISRRSPARTWRAANSDGATASPLCSTTTLRGRSFCRTKNSSREQGSSAVIDCPLAVTQPGLEFRVIKESRLVPHP